MERIRGCSLARARTADQVVITFDKDFGEPAVVRRQLHAGIVRLVGLPGAQQTPVAAATLTRYPEELGRGALVTAESGRTRVRPGEV